MRPSSSLPLLLVATVACGDPPTGEAALSLHAAVRDSAGVRIVENPRPPTGSRLDWRVGAEPAVTIGELEGEEPYMLHRPRDATILPDGRIVVANTGSNELRVFDSSGRHLETWGGSGEGPGEFTSLIQVHRWPGDSLLALYSPGRRLSVLDSEGNYGRSFTLQLDDSFFLVEAVSPGGAILTSDLVMRGGLPNGLTRLRDHFRVRTAEGEPRPSLGSFPAEEWFFQATGPGTSSGSTIPFGHEVSAFAWGDLMAVAPNDTYEVRVFGLDGTLKRIVRRDHDLIATTPEHIDALIADVVTREERAERRRQLREYYLEVPVPETHPAFDEAMSDEAGHLWVREYNLPGEGDPDPVWTVFDPDGQVLGFVETPAGLSIFEIGEDYILGLARDDLGVEYVRMWSLERSGR